MDGVSTMDLNSGMSDMTPVFSFDPGVQPQMPPQQQQQTQYQLPPPINSGPQQPPPPKEDKFPLPPPINAPEKNIPKNKMDSTPISDIMMGGGVGGDFPAGQMGGSPDPRFMMEGPPTFVQQAQPIPNGYQQKMVSASKNPLNLTDEQMEALLAGLVAVIAFSSAVQGKLSTSIPQFLGPDGQRSTVGLLITAVLAAAIFYFGKRFVVKDA